LPRGEQERDLFLVAGEPDRHGHARPDHAVGPRRLTDPGVLQDRLNLQHPALVLALFFLGRVVSAVFAEITLFAGCFNSLRDLDPQWSRAIIQFGLEPVVRLLGQPGDASFAGLGHGHSSALRGPAMSRGPWPAPM